MKTTVQIIQRDAIALGEYLGGVKYWKNDRYANGKLDWKNIAKGVFMDLSTFALAVSIIGTATKVYQFTRLVGDLNRDPLRGDLFKQLNVNEPILLKKPTPEFDPYFGMSPNTSYQKYEKTTYILSSHLTLVTNPQDEIILKTMTPSIQTQNILDMYSQAQFESLGLSDEQERIVNERIISNEKRSKEGLQFRREYEEANSSGEGTESFPLQSKATSVQPPSSSDQQFMEMKNKEFGSKALDARGNMAMFRTDLYNLEKVRAIKIQWFGRYLPASFTFAATVNTADNFFN